MVMENYDFDKEHWELKNKLNKKGYLTPHDERRLLLHRENPLDVRVEEEKIKQTKRRLIKLNWFAGTYSLYVLTINIIPFHMKACFMVG